MGNDRASTTRARQAASLLLAGLCAGALLLTAALALAAEPTNLAPPVERPGFFASIGRWFHEQAARFDSNLQNARAKVEDLGREAGTVAKNTVEGAKDAAGAVARIPSARVASGHEKCALAPNGAPDCAAAAEALCKANGFASGNSIDMTTAEICPAQVYLSGRTTGEGCHTETFVSRALCQ